MSDVLRDKIKQYILDESCNPKLVTGAQITDNIMAIIAAHEAVMVEALRYYADQENWKYLQTGIGRMPPEIDQDEGDRARSALSSIGL